MWRVTNYFQYFIVQAMCSLPSFLCVLFPFPFTDSSGCNEKKIQTILSHFLKQEITRLNNKCRNLDILRLEP